jgi:hypothetical protein
MGETPMKVQKVVHIIRPRAPTGNGSVLWPVGLNFQGDKARHTVQHFGKRTGFTIAILETREALSEVAGRKV